MDFNPMELRRDQLERAPLALAYRGGDIQAWQKKAKDKLAGLLAMPQEKPQDDEFTVEWERDHETFRETRFYFCSEPGVRTPAHFLLPKKPGPPPPLVICLQGHGTGMHNSLGRNLRGEEDGGIRNGDHAYALQCIDRGMAALILELRGFGENGGLPQDRQPNCRLLAGSALLVGRTLAGERAWDVSRAIDAALDHLEGFDRNRIGIMGVSGGGSSAFYTALMEPRISAALLGCCFSSYAASIGLISHCPCNYIPRITDYFEMGDLAGLLAPRPLLVLNGNQDTIFPLEDAERQFAAVKKIYAALGAESQCAFVVAQGGHGFYPAPAWAAFSRLTGWA